MKITLHTPETIYSRRHLPSWLLLAAAAGAVNGFAYLMCEEFVTHVTGTVTRVGLAWRTISLMLEFVLVVVCFIAGAATSVMAIQARARRGQTPRWATPLIVVSLILAAVAVAGRMEVFGPYHVTVASDSPPFVVLSILAYAMGLQNAAVATTTGLAVRTTHLSGPATDLGIHLGVACLSKGAERRSALQGAVLRGGKMIAFGLGAVLAVELMETYEYLTLFAPAFFVLIATLLSFTTWTPSDLI